MAAATLLQPSFSSANETAAARLVPATAQGMLVVEDVGRLSENWANTQLGQLMSDPAMKPFLNDVQRQLRAKLMETRLRLGMQVAELADVTTGAFMLAATQPNHDPNSHALVVIVETAGKSTEAKQLMAAAADKLGGAQQVQVNGVAAIKAVVKDAAGAVSHHVYYAMEGDRLIATDNQRALSECVATLRGTAQSMLSNPSFQHVMKRVDGDQGDIRWYVNLFGYAQLCKASSGAEGKVAQMLASQGFLSVESAGGMIRLADGKHELLHRSFVYAPKGTDKLEKAARLLAFVNSANTAKPLTWAPAASTNLLQLNFDFRSAFAGLKPIVNAIADDDVFDTMIHNIAHEPSGPRVDIQREVLPNLGAKVAIFSDNKLPVQPDSERMMLAIEVKNERVIAAALGRLLRTEPRVRKVKHGKLDIWEFVPPKPVEDEFAIDIEAGFDFGEAQPAAAPTKSTDDMLPNAAVTVSRGHVLVATHIEYLKEMLAAKAEGRLCKTDDCQRVKEALEKLGGGNDTVHFFTRLDGAIQVTYELLRTGRMAESKSVLGVVLNLLNQDGAANTQQFDGSQMPPFIEIARYLGPHGMYMQTEKQGWLLSGCLLKK